jgi:hypothetical protein
MTPLTRDQLLSMLRVAMHELYEAIRDEPDWREATRLSKKYKVIYRAYKIIEG